MGIPSFFSYILKKYSDIVLKLDKHNISQRRGLSFNFFPNKELKFVNFFDGGGTSKSTIQSIKMHNLYMDCNSIIYDKFNYLVKLASIGLDPSNNTKLKTISEDIGWLYSIDIFEDILITHVISKIEEYIEIIQPTNRLYICFDGVSPLAKMEQQRIRRYKGEHLKFISNEWIGLEANTTHTVFDEWSSSNITPGTAFMKKVTSSIRSHFNGGEKKYKVKKLLLSLSNEYGEGEHKIFNDIRKQSLLKENSAIYGLDADLIMLSLLNPFCNNIYIFRESPNFLRNTGSQLATGIKQSNLNNSKKQLMINELTSKENDRLLFLDIEKLASCIGSELCGEDNQHKRIWDNSVDEFHYIQDYVFLCFFLGNDFMPKAPAFNIRNNGIEKLIQLYKSLNYSNMFYFITKSHSNNIFWPSVKLFIMKLAMKEEENLLIEYNDRQKYDKYKWKIDTRENKENYLNNIPVISRKEESYISPQINKWQDRYYVALFLQKRTSVSLKSICLNYLECLEWTYKYYTGNCVNWRWSYEYSYAPLFVDVVKYIPDHIDGGLLSNARKLRGFGIISLSSKLKNRTTSFSNPKENSSDIEESVSTFISILKHDNPLQSHTQLAFVLPPNNHNLLPSEFKNYLNKKYKSSYVYSYEQLQYQWAFCKYLWEAHIKLPEISLEVLEEWDKYL